MLTKKNFYAIVPMFFGWSISFIMIWASLVVSNVGAITITANNSNTKVFPSSFSNESNHTRQSPTDMTMMKMMERGWIHTFLVYELEILLGLPTIDIILIAYL